MHCVKCGKKIDADAKFCIHCGIEIKNHVNDSEKILFSINISKTQTIVLYDEFLRYKGERINYLDIQGMSYLLTRTKNSINFIPTHNSTSFTIKLEANGKIYDMGSSTTSFMFFTGDREKEINELFGKLVYILDNVIKPFVLNNLIARFEIEKILKIGDLTITPEGLYKKRSFWRSPEKLNWVDYYNSVLYQGNLQVLKTDAKDKFKLYLAIPMNVINAVVLPEFLSVQFSKSITSEERITREKQSVINENKFCPSCAGPIELSDKFCLHCGSKLT